MDGQGGFSESVKRPYLSQYKSILRHDPNSGGGGAKTLNLDSAFAGMTEGEVDFQSINLEPLGLKPRVVQLLSGYKGR